MARLANSVALENLFVAAVILLSAAASRLIGAASLDISLLWPPTALMLAHCLRRGPIALPGAALGIGLWCWLAGHSPYATLLMIAATTVPPWLAAALFRHWMSERPDESSTRISIRLLMVSIVVQSPLAALLGAAAMADHALARTDFPLFAAGYLLIECTSALVLAPLAYVWLPERDPAKKSRRKDSAVHAGHDWPTTLYLVAVTGACLALHGAGQQSASRWLVFAAIWGPLFSALRGGAHSSTLNLALAATTMLVLRAWLYAGEPTQIIRDALLPTWLCITVLAVFQHLLNAMALERNAQARRLETAALQSELPGLASARGLHRMLSGLTRSAVHRPFRVAEIFVPDILRAGELLGRTAMIELELAAAARLREIASRYTAMIAHLSTGRFAIVTSATVSDEKLVRVVNSALQEQAFKVAGRMFHLRASTGVIDVPAGTTSNAAAIMAALSLAQQSAFDGAEKFQKFPLGSRVLQQVWAEMDLEQSVTRALQQKRVKLMAQLIAPCQRGTETLGLHYEVLARLIDERGNIVSPAVFLPAIARAGLTREFDRLVIESTFSYLAGDADLRSRTLVCAINVTGGSMGSPELPALIEEQLRRTGLSPRMLAIEITESESIANIGVAKANAQALAKLGLTIAVDDFGTGLATFDYLKQFNPQMLKIDGSFIRNFDDSPLDRAIVQSIVRVAGTIGARTVAEWVETEELARKLRGLGIDFLQGYAIAKPVPIDQLSGTQPALSFLSANQESPTGVERRRQPEPAVSR